MARGQLIAESLKIGERFRSRGVRLLGATRVEPPEERLRADQPRRWTFIGFEMDDELAPAVAEDLAVALDGEVRRQRRKPGPHQRRFVDIAFDEFGIEQVGTERSHRQAAGEAEAERGVSDSIGR